VTKELLVTQVVC